MFKASEEEVIVLLEPLGIPLVWFRYYNCDFDAPYNIIVGNLHIPDYKLPWEDESFQYPSNFAPPLEVLIEASNGASDYGNKFGEPLISGFVRSFGLDDGQERR